jgi:hypothetical protein
MASALRLYRATVVSVDDPQGLGRVRLGIVRNVRGAPEHEEGWAAVGVTPLGGGTEVTPAYGIGDIVLYAAERLPFVGAVLLCRQSSSAAAADSPAGLLRIALGRGDELTVEAGAGALRLSTSAGQQFTLQASGAIDASGSELTLRASKIALVASALTVDVAMVGFAGTIQCDTIVANSVVAASYTPGAGNIS